VRVRVRVWVLSQKLVFYVKQFLRYRKVFYILDDVHFEYCNKMVEASKSQVAYINILK